MFNSSQPASFLGERPDNGEMAGCSFKIFHISFSEASNCLAIWFGVTDRAIF